MKRLIYIILSVLFFFNDFSAQGVDLPEFVIEGVQKVKLPKIKKSSPKFIKPLGEEYFRHKFSPEDFDVKVSGSPDTTIAIPFIRGISYSGRMKIAGGVNTLPTGELYAKFSNDNLLLTISGNGEHINNYEPYSAFFRGNSKFDLEYFFNETDKNKAFNFLRLSGNGGYYDRNFWASETPALKRKALFGQGEFVFGRFSPDKYKFSFMLGGNYANLLKENLNEQNLNGKISAEINFSPFLISGNFSVILQRINTNAKPKTYFYAGNLKTRIKMSDNIKLDLGGIFAFDEEEKFFYPIFGITYNISKFFTFKASIKSETEFNFNYNLIRINPFYEAKNFYYTFTRRIDKIGITGIFNYYNYLSASVSARYGSIDGFLYYDDSQKKGIFVVNTLNDVRTASVDFNLNFFYSAFGYFSLNSNFSDIRLANGYVAPYSPKIKVKASYDFNYLKNLLFSFGCEYFSHYYADIQNTKKIEPGWNLWASAKYNIFGNFNLTIDANNILKKNIYFLPGYKSLPFEIVLGAEIFWK